MPFGSFLGVTAFRALTAKRFRPAAVCLLLTAGGWWASRAYTVSEFQYGRDFSSARERMEGSRRELLVRKEIASAAVSSSPADRDRLWLRLAALRRSLGDLEGAVGVLRGTLREDPDRPRLWFDLAGLLDELGEKESAGEAHRMVGRAR